MKLVEDIPESVKIAVIVLLVLFTITDIVVYFFLARKYKKLYHRNIYNLGIICLGLLVALIAGIATLTEGDMLGIPIVLVSLLFYGIIIGYDIMTYGKKDGIKIACIQIFLCLGSIFEFAELEAFRKKSYHFESFMDDQDLRK